MCWRAQGAKVTGHRDPLPHQAAACGGRARARGRARNGILWRWRTQSPGGWDGGGRGPPPEPHRAATRPRGRSVTAQPESFLGPAGPSSKAVAGLQWGWERALLPPVRIHSPYPVSCPVLGLLTDRMFGRGQGGLPTQGTARCGWGPAQGRRVSALSCPARGSLSGRPG